ncbi:hypothetical protein [Nonomuraea jabiensis]
MITANLRRALEPGRLPRARPGLLIGRPPGYLLAAAREPLHVATSG